MVGTLDFCEESADLVHVITFLRKIKNRTGSKILATTKKPTTRKRGSQNYLNNARLLEHIKLSKTVWEARKKGVNDPDAMPTAAQCMTPELVMMLMMLVDKYATRANWRGYCVDMDTECLTKRGWLSGDQVKQGDSILSFDDGRLVWSDVHSVFQDDFEGEMFHLTVQGMDALVTPGHKFVTTEGLRRVEYLREKDCLVMIGSEVDGSVEIYTDSFVELVGWVITEGNYHRSEDRNYTRVTIFQNEGEFADRIRKCTASLGYGASEYHRSRVVGIESPVQVAFHLKKDLCRQIEEVAPNKVPTNEFLLNLSANQRLLLIDTMVDGDGWKTNGYTNYTQASKEHIDFFVALCTLSGKRTSVAIRPPVGYGKKNTYTVRVFSKGERSMVENIDFHKGKSGRSGKPKVLNPNFATESYKGLVWCPRTEHGCFMARRNGTVFLTGNTYIDDMKSEATISLLTGALKFNPEVSQNPFGYLTQIVTHSFLTTLDKEKKVRKIKDDILEQNGYTPSHTRQLENDANIMLRQLLNESYHIGGHEQAVRALMSHGKKEENARELVQTFVDAQKQFNFPEESSEDISDADDC